MKLILLLFSSFLFGEIDQIHFAFSNDPIDVVIPCTPKDTNTLEPCIQGIKENGKNIRRIIVLSKEKMTDSAEWFDENLYPFSMEAVAHEIFQGNEGAANQFLSHPKTRIGWIFQQILKLYAPFVIPDISPNVLVLDSDVVFLNSTEFMTKEGEPYFAYGDEYFSAYFDHAKKLIPGHKKVYPDKSGIVHHMLLQRPILEDMFQIISQAHKTEPWKAICRCINHEELFQSCMSEYEIYFNFALLRTPQARLRELKWTNIHTLQYCRAYKLQRYNYVACHTWLREIYGRRPF